MVRVVLLLSLLGASMAMNDHLVQLKVMNGTAPADLSERHIELVGKTLNTYVDSPNVFSCAYSHTNAEPANTQVNAHKAFLVSLVGMDAEFSMPCLDKLWDLGCWQREIRNALSKVRKVARLAIASRKER